jgi:hypothetical protein
MGAPLDPLTEGLVLFVSACPDQERLASHYERVVPLEAVEAPIARGRAYLFRLDGPRTPLARLVRCFAGRRGPGTGE